MIIVTHSKKVSCIADEVWGINKGQMVFVKGASSPERRQQNLQKGSEI